MKSSIYATTAVLFRRTSARAVLIAVAITCAVGSNAESAAPDPVLALWHAYNDPATNEDVLDSSHNGSIGEYKRGDLLPNRKGKDENCLRLYGEFEKRTCMGYRIMPSEKLRLKQGMVSFWVMIDPSINTKRGIIFAQDKAKYIGIDCKDGKAKLDIAFGRRMGAKDLPVREWFHLAWAFTESSQELFINGKSVIKDAKGGASIDGSAGLFVGNDGSDFDLKKIAEKGFPQGSGFPGADGFAGLIDDLRIFNKVVEPIIGSDTPPDSEFPKLGLVLHWDFEEKSALPDRSGQGLDGVVDSDKQPDITGVKGFTSWNKDDKAWSFTWATTNDKMMTQVKTPIDPRLQIPSGTLEIRLQIKEFHPSGSGGVPFSWYPLSIAYGEGDGVANFMWTLSQYDSAAKKVLGHLELRVTGTSHTVNAKIMPGRWYKIVMMWDSRAESPKDRWMKFWINDEYAGYYDNSGISLRGASGRLKLGQNRDRMMNSEGASMLVSDLKIWNYAMSVYMPDPK
ncbi:MAG: LamG-like jellyroll fold domain-containing protein [Planctomycetota bacterium]